jgi:hypothetical protein
MEEDLNEDNDNSEESREYYFSSKNPLTKYCFTFMEYVRSVSPEIFQKATDYASDQVGITITDFDIEELDDEIDDIDTLEDDLEDIFEEVDEDEEYNDGYDDDEQQEF